MTEDENEDDENTGEVHEGYRSEVHLVKRKIDVAEGMVIEENVVSLKSADVDMNLLLRMADAQFQKQKSKGTGGRKYDKKDKWRE